MIVERLTRKAGFVGGLNDPEIPPGSFASQKIFFIPQEHLYLEIAPLSKPLLSNPRTPADLVSYGNFNCQLNSRPGRFSTLSIYKLVSSGPQLEPIGYRTVGTKCQEV